MEITPKMLFFIVLISAFLCLMYFLNGGDGLTDSHSGAVLAIQILSGF